MKGKKRFAALLCMVVLVCALLPPLASASSTVYLLSINDKMCDLPGGVRPVPVDGSIYVPYTVFDKDVTGIDLGVYYGLSQDSGSVLTLYSRADYLTFDVNIGECVDSRGTVQNFRAVYRNGLVYVPAADVCSFFGLKLSILPTGDRGTLVRVTNGDATMEDNRFLSFAVQAMTVRYNDIMKSQLPPPPTPALPPPPPPPPAPAGTPKPTPNPEATARPTPPPVPTPSPTPTPNLDENGNVRHDHIQVYLAVDASHAPEDLLDQLPASAPRMLLLFTPRSLAEHSALIRQAVSLGHSIGFRVEGTSEEVFMELDEANYLLSHIARIHTRIVSPAGETLTDALTRAGWYCWTPDLTDSSAYSIMTRLDEGLTPVRVTVPASSSLLSQLIRELRTLHYTLRQPLETEL